MNMMDNNIDKHDYIYDYKFATQLTILHLSLC